MVFIFVESDLESSYYKGWNSENNHVDHKGVDELDDSQGRFLGKSIILSSVVSVVNEE